MYLNSIEEAITIKDLLMPMCGQKKAFVYEIDQTKDFYKEIVRHEDKLNCQNLYFKHYSKTSPELLYGDEEEQIEEVARIGICYIHPTADIHPEAVVRYLC